MADAAEAGAVTKSGAKNAKSEAQKYYKRKNDPTGLAKIDEGDVFMKAGDFAKAKECYDVAYDICKNSTVERAAKPKGEAPPKVAKEANAPAVQAESSAKLLLVLFSLPIPFYFSIPLVPRHDTSSLTRLTNTEQPQRKHPSQAYA